MNPRRMANGPSLLAWVVATALAAATSVFVGCSSPDSGDADGPSAAQDSDVSVLDTAVAKDDAGSADIEPTNVLDAAAPADGEPSKPTDADAAVDMLETADSNPADAALDGATSTLPDLVVTQPVVPPATMYTPGSPVSFKLTVKNAGGAAAKSFILAVVLSPDAKLDYDPKLKPGDPGYGSQDKLIVDSPTSTFSNLNAGASLPIQRTFAVPKLPTGSYRLIAWIDAGQTVAESNETNNIAMGAPAIVVP